MCWHVDLNNAAVQWGGPWKHDPSRLFRSLTWQVSTRVRGVEIQSLVQYWIKTVYCESKDHFHWPAPCTPLVPKVGALSPPPPGYATHALKSLDITSILNLSIGFMSTNALNINFCLLPTKFLLPVNLATLTIWSLFNLLEVPAPHLLPLFLAHQQSPHWKSDRSFR